MHQSNACRCFWPHSTTCPQHMFARQSLASSCTGRYLGEELLAWLSWVTGMLEWFGVWSRWSTYKEKESPADNLDLQQPRLKPNCESANTESYAVFLLLLFVSSSDRKQPDWSQLILVMNNSTWWRNNLEEDCVYGLIHRNIILYLQTMKCFFHVKKKRQECYICPTGVNTN